MGKNKNAMGQRLKHLSEKQIDKLILEEPDIDIRGYLDLLKEIENIEKSMEQPIEDDDLFFNKYKFIPNKLAADAPFEGLMYQPYGIEHNAVKLHNPRQVWTIIDDGLWYGIVAGMRVVNRVGYLLTEQFWEHEEEHYTICRYNEDGSIVDQ